MQAEKKYTHCGPKTKTAACFHDMCNWTNDEFKHETLCRKLKLKISLYSYFSNKIRSTNFTNYNFLFIAIMNQFQRLTNIYFLTVFVLSMSPLSPKKSAFNFIPITAVFSISITKDFLEFRKKKNEDLNENRALAQKYNFEKDEWRFIYREDIRPGDIICIEKNQVIPADLILLKTSIESGLCSINTSSLDGETGLKIKRAATIGDNLSYENRKIRLNAPCVIESCPPNSNMGANGFTGKISFGANHHPLDMTSFLPRGCVLKNTDWIICAAIFVGEETKLQKEIKFKKSISKSNMEKNMEKIIILIGLAQLVVIVLFTVLRGIFNVNRGLWYLNYYNPTALGYVGSALGLFVIISTSIPISLYVTLEVVKIMIASQLKFDRRMWTKDRKKTAKTRSINLIDDLGQVRIVFSDKTGTLTKNNMTFVACSVQGEVYSVTKEKSSNSEVVEKLRNGDVWFNEFLTLVSVCHTGFTEIENGQFRFQAESPDEKALLTMAMNHKYLFKNRSFDKIKIKDFDKNIQKLDIKIFGKTHQFNIIECFEFDPNRKRLSVLVLDPRDNKLKLYSKGAENVIFKLLTRNPQNDYIFKKTNEQIDELSAKGLRILVCAYKQVDTDFYLSWRHRYTAVLSRGDAEIQALVEELETGLDLLGATAVEDELQDEVKETLEALTLAGLAVWVLTGDKMQTAFDITKSCGLLKPQMFGFPNLLIFDSNEGDGADVIKAKVEEMWAAVAFKEKGSKDQAMMISGTALSVLFPKNDMCKILSPVQKMFMGTVDKCIFVICCRVSPAQKSKIVQLYKKYNPSDVTLAIGDGANDVPMLQIANVGVGIEGREGQQAARNSDFSITEFKHLKDLLLFHGAMNYARIAKLIRYFFYKNLLVTFIIIVHNFFTGFSNVLIISPDSILFHNLVYNTLSIIYNTVYDVTYNRETAFEWPHLYQTGVKNELLSFKKFRCMVLYALYQSMTIYFLHYVIFISSFISSNGLGMNRCHLSFSLYLSIINVVMVHMLFEINSINYGFLITVLIYSTPSWAAFSFACNHVKSMAEEDYKCIPEVLQEPIIWILMAFSVFACSAPLIIYRFFKEYNWPSAVRIARELEKISEREPGFFVIQRMDRHVECLSRRFTKEVNETVGHEEYQKNVGTSWRDFVRSKIVHPMGRVN